MRILLRQLALVLAISSIFSGNARAACEDILRYVGYNVQRNYAALTTDQILSTQLCEEEYSKAGAEKRLAIEASYKVFSLGVDGSAMQISEEQRKRCDNKYGRDFRDSLNITEAQTVSSEAMDAVRACYGLTSGLSLVSLVATDTSFSAQIKWQPSGGGAVSMNSLIISKNPEPVADCKIAVGTSSNARLPVQISASTTVNLSCDRLPVKSGSTQRFIRYPSGIVTVSTVGGAISIPLPEIRRSLTPDDRLAALEASTAALADAILLTMKACTSLGARWQELPEATGRYLLGADGNKRRAGEKGGNSVIALNNLPPLRVPGLTKYGGSWNNGISPDAFLSGDNKITLTVEGTDGPQVAFEPAWIALNACVRS